MPKHGTDVGLQSGASLFCAPLYGNDRATDRKCALHEEYIRYMSSGIHKNLVPQMQSTELLFGIFGVTML
jgi:hypothetical protein